MTLLSILIVAIYATFIIAGILAVFQLTRRNMSQTSSGRVGNRRPPEGVSVLKPLCGADDDLVDNLRTFFTQSHPDYALVFGVEGKTDPALHVVRVLREQYPNVRCKVVVHDGHRGINPKVANLRAMLDAVAHDIVVISDSNCAVDPDYLNALTQPLQDGEAGLTTSLVAGVSGGGGRLGASLDNLHMNGHVMGAIATSHLLGATPAVLGKSMAFRRSAFERLGGFESVATVLAEDYVMGRMYAEAGFRVAVAGPVVRTINRRASVGGFWRRQLRWSMMRTRLNPVRYVFEPLSMPLFAGVLALLVGGPAWLAGLCLGLGLFRDALLSRRLSGSLGLLGCLRLLPLTLLREMLVALIWMIAPFKRHVAWRGHRVRISSGTRLYVQDPRVLGGANHV